MLRLSCSAVSDAGFDAGSREFREVIGILVSGETLRTHCQAEAAKMQDWQSKLPVGEDFADAPGNIEFQMDAGKVNTLDGWRDYKLACFAKRPSANPADASEWDIRVMPPPSARVIYGAMESIETLETEFRPWASNLGIRDTHTIHVLGDGAEWIWNSVNAQFPGCMQTLDVFHGFEYIADASKALYPDSAQAAKTVTVSALPAPDSMSGRSQAADSSVASSEQATCVDIDKPTSQPIDSSYTSVLASPEAPEPTVQSPTKSHGSSETSSTAAEPSDTDRTNTNTPSASVPSTDESKSSDKTDSSTSPTSRLNYIPVLMGLLAFGTSSPPATDSSEGQSATADPSPADASTSDPTLGSTSTTSWPSSNPTGSPFTAPAKKSKHQTRVDNRRTQAESRRQKPKTPQEESYEMGRSALLNKGWLGVCEYMAKELGKADTPMRRSILEGMLSYFAKHTNRLNYRANLEAGRPIGSGMIEGNVKTMGLRLKARGARWKGSHVKPMLALLSLRSSSYWSLYWATNAA